MAVAGLARIVPAVPRAIVPDGGARAGSNEAAQLYQRGLVLDCNSAPTAEDELELKLPMSQLALDRVRESGVNVIKWTLGGLDSGFVDTIAEIASIERLIELHPAYFTQVRVPQDLVGAKREGRLGVILSFESVEMLEGRLDRL